MQAVNDRISMLPVGSVHLTEGNVYADKLRSLADGLFTRLNFGAMSDLYRNKANQFAAGEFWGKIMRAAAMIYRSSGDSNLLAKMEAAVDDMQAIQGEDGELSTAPLSEQPNGSAGADLWERKYVMLGLIAYYEVTQDERSLYMASRLLDYTISQVGSEGCEKGKTDILQTGWAFCGIESSSILEPTVRLYEYTGKQEYYDFALYIYERGGCSRENMFDAIASGKSPYLIGDNGDPHMSIAKAYEMMSCFEGVCELYRVTGDNKYLQSACKLYDKLIEEEITYLGSGGADAPFNLGAGTGEQWNRTRYEQANPDINLMMETCVTVTWVKLCLQLLRLTGDVRYAEQIEISLRNAVTGALKPDGMFFEYFPRFNGVRNSKVNFSYDVGGFALSCCTANGPMGLALLPYTAYMMCDGDILINFHTDADISLDAAKYQVRTAFPQEGYTKINVTGVSKARMRIARMSYQNNICVTITRNGCDKRKAKLEGSNDNKGYLIINEDISDSVIEISFDIKDVAHVSHGSINPQGNGLVLLMHGSVVMSRDKRNDPQLIENTTPVPLPFGGFEKGSHDTGRLLNLVYEGIPFVDYMSAGNTWDDSSAFVTWSPSQSL